MKIRMAIKDEVRAVLLHPEFFPLMSEGDPSDDIKIDMSEYWLLFEDRGETIALFNFTPITNVCMEMHPLIFKKHRLQHARTCIEYAFRWFLDMGGRKLVVNIPDNRPELVNFAKHHGFIEEGINRESLMQSGHIINIIHLGITKDEINSYLEESWAS